MHKNGLLDKEKQEASQLLEMMNCGDTTSLDLILSRLEQLTYFNTFIEQFKGTQRSDLINFCSRLRMEYFKGGDIVFKEHDASNDKLYIIVYGSVMLMRQKAMQSLKLNQCYQTMPHSPQNGLVQIMNLQKFSRKLMAQKIDQNISIIEKKTLTDKYGDSLRIMKKGEGFGDKALRENAPRSLTVAAYSTDLYLVVLKKQDFMQFTQQFDKQMRDKSRLIFSIFKNVNTEYSSARLEAMIYSCETERHNKGQRITFEDHQADHFYIIQSGEIVLTKQNNGQTVRICVISSGHITLKAWRMSFLIGRHLNGLIIFGEEIICNQTSTYEYTAIVQSINAQVIVIQAAQFESKFPPECLNQIKQDYNAKRDYRNNLFNKVIADVRKPRAQSNADILQVSQIDFTPSPGRHTHITNSKDVIITSSFLKNYKNPSVQEFCLKSIIQNESNLTLKTSPNYRSQKQKQATMEQFNFGNITQQEQKRQDNLFFFKLNIRRPQENFLKPNLKVLPKSIKSDLLKGFKKSNRKFYQFDKMTYISSYEVSTRISAVHTLHTEGNEF